MRSRVSKTPNDDVSFYNLGAALAGEGRFKEAGEVYQQILRRTPTDARLLTSLGVALDGQGDSRGAEVQFRAAMNAHPPACDARFDLANMELRERAPIARSRIFAHSWKLAFRTRRCMQAWPRRWRMRAAIRTAAAEFEEALKLNPDHEASLVGLASIELNENQADAALRAS